MGLSASSSSTWRAGARDLDALLFGRSCGDDASRSLLLSSSSVSNFGIETLFVMPLRRDLPLSSSFVVVAVVAVGDGDDGSNVASDGGDTSSRLHMYVLDFE